MKRILNITFAFVLVSSLVLLASNSVSAQTKTGTGQRGALFVDKDGDGICDNVGTHAGQGMNKAAGKRGQGVGNGTGTGSMGKGAGMGTGVCTGTCTGTGTGTGTGVCDGTGPKGAARGRK
jgi:hypothetical protein